MAVQHSLQSRHDISGRKSTLMSSHSIDPILMTAFSLHTRQRTQTGHETYTHMWVCVFVCKYGWMLTVDCVLPDCQPAHLVLPYCVSCESCAWSTKIQQTKETPLCLSQQNAHTYKHIHIASFTLFLTHPRQTHVTYVLPYKNRLRKRKWEKREERCSRSKMRKVR